MKHFNTSGPCNPEDHYMLPATTRLPELRRLIDQKLYFVIHAPRQVGKTTMMMQLAQELTREGRYTSVLVSMEVGAAFNDDIGEAELAMLGAWRENVRTWLPAELQPPEWPQSNTGQRIIAALGEWARQSSRPLVIFLDEIDALENGALISVLRQLRNGFNNRPQGFPWSLALIGMRDVRDYKVKSGGSERLNTASPFNIKARSLTIGNFTAEEVATLYHQHTTETGQAFTDEAVAHAFHLTQGQPYMVNALAKVSVEELQPDVAQPITINEIEKAKEILIQRRETHLDSLAERLREERVLRVIEPILAGKEAIEIPDDDLRFVVDLGLVQRANGDHLRIANPIYQEVIPRVLTSSTQRTIVQEAKWYVMPDGRLDMNKLLTAFQQFFRENSESWVERFDYKEAGPQLLLQAFLQRIINGGGRVEREYGLGRKRTDLLVIWQIPSGVQRVVMELKIGSANAPAILSKGLEQTAEYMDKCGAVEGHLVCFDRSPDKTWDDKLFTRAENHQSHTIYVWGM